MATMRCYEEELVAVARKIGAEDKACKILG